MYQNFTWSGKINRYGLGVYLVFFVHGHRFFPDFFVHMLQLWVRACVCVCVCVYVRDSQVFAFIEVLGIHALDLSMELSRGTSGLYICSL